MSRSIGLFTRYPGTMAVFGLISGLASFFLVNRDQELFAQLISLLMLASWVWLTLENLLRQSVSRWFGIKMPEPLLKFAAQLVHQESLFFVIPFFVITTTWNTPQAIFTCLLIVAAFVSVVDPLYHRWLVRHRWLYFFFHGFTLFSALLVALPILIQIPTAEAYVVSAAVAIVLSLLNIISELKCRYWQRALVTLALTGATTVVGVLVRQWVPPATLWLTQIAIANQMDTERRAPTNQLSVVEENQLRNGLYAYTSVHAPRGLNEHIYHVWHLNGQQIDKIALDIVGGREAGYRAWTHKLNFPTYPHGHWRIDVVTEAGQLIGVLRFQVVDEGSHNSVGKAVAETSGNPHKTPASAVRLPFIEFFLNEGRELLAAIGAEWKPASETASPAPRMRSEAVPEAKDGRDAPTY